MVSRNTLFLTLASPPDTRLLYLMCFIQRLTATCKHEVLYGSYCLYVRVIQLRIYTQYRISTLTFIHFLFFYSCNENAPNASKICFFTERSHIVYFMISLCALTMVYGRDQRRCRCMTNPNVLSSSLPSTNNISKAHRIMYNNTFIYSAVPISRG